MAYMTSLPFDLILTILCILHSLEGTLANSVPYLNPGFEFNYNKADQQLPLPLTNQCDEIHITWGRTVNENGPSPVAPYFMQVYNSASSVPYVVDAGFGAPFDWTVPFPPNTQYQTCMFDANGVSGGCQALYTMLPNTTTTNSTSSCQLPSSPAALLVSAVVPSGPMAQYSQINQCETLSVTPQSGSPPFILTVSPESHPPYNITSNNMNAIPWTVSVPVGFKFFLMLSSADGQLWANGPMSVGGLGSSSCFVPGIIRTSLLEKAVIGASVGGLAVGFAAGLFAFYVFFRVKNRRRAPSQQFFASNRNRDYSAADSPTRPLKAPPSTSTLGRSTSFGAVSSVPSDSTHTTNSIPLTPTTAARHSVVPRPPLPQIPVMPNQRNSRRQRSASREPYAVVPTDASPMRTEYPADIKQALPPSDTSIFSRDDTESLASSSNTHIRTTGRPLSTISRAPTYVPRSSHLRGTAHTIEEAEPTPELPPEYGRHTDDPYLKYAPSVLSSGNRF